MTTICGNGHIVTPQDRAMAVTQSQNAFQEIKQEGVLPPKAILRVVDNYPGISAPASYASPQGSINVDPKVMACLTPVETKGVLLHESGHINEPTINSGTAHALIAGALFYFGVVRPAAALIFKRKKPHFSMKKTLTRLGAGTVLWTVAGLITVKPFREMESKADLYSAQHLHSVAPVEDGLKKEIAIRRSDGSEKIPASTAAEIMVAQFGYRFGRFVFFGPAAFNKDTHMTVPERVEYLEANRGKVTPAPSTPINPAP